MLPIVTGIKFLVIKFVHVRFDTSMPGFETTAVAFKNSKLGIPILIGKEEIVKEQLKNIGLDSNFDIEISSSKDNQRRENYFEFS